MVKLPITNGAYMATYNHIADLLSNKKLSHRDMAGMLGISKTTLYRLVRADLLPRPKPQPTGWARFDGNEVINYLPKLMSASKGKATLYLKRLEGLQHD